MDDETATSEAGGAALAVARDALAGHLDVGAAALRLQDEERAALVDGTVRRTTTWAVEGVLWRVVVDSSPLQPAGTVVEVADTRAPGRGATGWDAATDARDRGRDHATRVPNPAVIEAVSALPPGTALDVACGTGRHALWLAERGWQVTGLDFSRNALAVAAGESRRRALPVRWVLGDARVWTPPDDGYDLVTMAFVHLPSVLSRAARWLRPGGRLVVVGHAVRNATDGSGGPRDPRLLHDVVDVAARVTGARLRVLVAREVERPVDGGVAVDAVLVATRLAAPA